MGEGLGQAIDLDASGRWAALLRAGAVEVWDASPRLARTLTQPGHRLERLVFSPSGRWLAGASADGAVHLWSVADDTRVLVRAAGPTVDALFFSVDEAALIFADQRPRLVAWDLTSGVGREMELSRAGVQRIDARPLADGNPCGDQVACVAGECR